MPKIMLLASDKGDSNFQNYGEYDVTAIPRVGEHVAISPNDAAWFRVVGVVHPMPSGLIEVWMLFDASQRDVQQRFAGS